MANRMAISLRALEVIEGSQLTGTVSFRDDVTESASIPTTAEYRVWDLDRNEMITDWTSLGEPAAQMPILLTPSDTSLESDSDNRRITGSRLRRRSLIVAADRGLSTQVIDVRHFRVRNAYGVDT